MADANDLTSELEVTERLAREAAQAILDVRERARANPEQKAGGQGPVTEADLAADKVLREGLRAAFPGDVVITEETWETGSAIETGPRTWFCDPLDGTEEFVRGREDYAVMVGLCIGGVPKLGVVAAPESGKVWRALVDEGRCERVDADGSVTALDVRDRAIGDTGPVVALSRSHPGRLTDYVADLVQGQAKKRGSVGLKMAMIIDGEADLYLTGSRRIKVWDTAGPSALLMAAGGIVNGLDGGPLQYVDKAAHTSGVRGWTPAAKELLEERVDHAIREWKANNRSS